MARFGGTLIFFRRHFAFFRTWYRCLLMMSYRILIQKLSFEAFTKGIEMLSKVVLLSLINIQSLSIGP